MNVEASKVASVAFRVSGAEWMVILIAAMLLPRALFVVADAILTLIFRKQEDPIRLDINVP